MHFLAWKPSLRGVGTKILWSDPRSLRSAKNCGIAKSRPPYHAYGDGRPNSQFSLMPTFQWSNATAKRLKSHSKHWEIFLRWSSILKGDIVFDVFSRARFKAMLRWSNALTFCGHGIRILFIAGDRAGDCAGASYVWHTSVSNLRSNLNVFCFSEVLAKVLYFSWNCLTYLNLLK